ncbi:MAG: cupin domain-containing protein [Pyrinomonadaceae bacterium]|nr:cupin domain-containing protein [Pyrinomonadaceae bacterium]
MSFYDWNNIKPDEITASYLRKIAVGENVTIARIEVRGDSITQPHSHENEEIIIVLKGAWCFNLPSGEVIIRANQMLLIPPGVEHSSRALEDTIAFDICSPKRCDWMSGTDQALHDDPEQYLWAV